MQAGGPQPGQPRDHGGQHPGRVQRSLLRRQDRPGGQGGGRTQGHPRPQHQLPGEAGGEEEVRHFVRPAAAGEWSAARGQGAERDDGLQAARVDAGEDLGPVGPGQGRAAGPVRVHGVDAPGVQVAAGRHDPRPAAGGALQGEGAGTSLRPSRIAGPLQWSCPPGKCGMHLWSVLFLFCLFIFYPPA